MPSLKSHLIAFVLKNTRKKAFASADGMNRWIEKSRRTQDHRPPQNLRKRVRITQREVAGSLVYEVEPIRILSDMRILYLHGGAYVFELTPHHWRLIAEMSERLGVRVTVPVYPLAPEHNIHAMFAMVMEVYRGLVSGASSGEIVFMGDSAGGNMAVVMTMMASVEGLPLPSRHVLISPGLDMTLTNPEVFAVEKTDPWLGIPGGLEAIRLYGAGIDNADWRISPTYGDLSVLPKTLLLTGTRDILSPDTLVFAQRARDAGVEIDLMVEQGMFHVWPLIDMPEARRARDRIVAFLSEDRPSTAKGATLGAAA